jgi:hypothetical protein
MSTSGCRPSHHVQARDGTKMANVESESVKTESGYKPEFNSARMRATASSAAFFPAGVSSIEID